MRYPICCCIVLVSENMDYTRTRTLFLSTVPEPFRPFLENEAMSDDEFLKGDGEAESPMDVLLAKHRKEKKDLKEKIQSMRKQAKGGNKKQKAECNENADKMEKEMAERHQREVAELSMQFLSVEDSTEKQENEAESASVLVPPEPNDSVHAADSDDEDKPFNNERFYKECTKKTKAMIRREKKEEKAKQLHATFEESRKMAKFSQRNLEWEAINKVLLDRGIKVVEVPSDGDCMFNALADQLARSSATTALSGKELRRRAANFMRAHPDEFLPFISACEVDGQEMDDIGFGVYCERLENDSTQWGGELELIALSKSLERTIEVIQPDGRVLSYGDSATKPLILTFHRHAYALDICIICTNSCDDRKRVTSDRNPEISVKSIGISDQLFEKEEWLDECLSFLESIGLLQNRNAQQVSNIVFEQWLHSDVKDSSYPTIEHAGLDVECKKAKLNSPLVLQITSVVDVGSSMHSQITKLTKEFVDNSGFEALPEKDDGNSFHQASKRCLLLEATDGVTSLKLFEYRKINSLSLLTAPGAKVLILPTTICRRGVLLLVPQLIQLIGGDSDSPICRRGRPVEVMADRLGIQPPKSRSRDKTSEQNMCRREEPSAHRIQASSMEASRLLSTSSAARSIYSNDNSVGDDCFDEMMDVDSEVPTEEQEVFDTEVDDNTNANEDLFETVPSSPHRTRGERVSLDDRRPKANIVVPQARLSSSVNPIGSHRPSTSVLPEPVQTSVVVMNRGNRGSPPPKKHRQSILRNKVKQETFEIIDLDDDSFEPTPLLNSLGDALQRAEKKAQERAFNNSTKRGSIETIEKQYAQCTPSTSSGMAANPVATDDPLVVRYRNLRIIRLTDATRQMRFAVGSSRKCIQCFVEDVCEPLRILDEMWTMKVTLRDESWTADDGLASFIDTQVLTQLIGLSPQEAMTIRNSENLERRKEGSAKLASVEAALERLDLIMQVEFFSRNVATPVIRSIQTLDQKLNEFD